MIHLPILKVSLHTKLQNKIKAMHLGTLILILFQNHPTQILLFKKSNQNPKIQHQTTYWTWALAMLQRPRTFQ
jgi:hypothetical protein